jgi:hypothetical protein
MRFPARAELPPGLKIPRLPALGTTWYERGFAYWARRIGGLIVLTATGAIYLAIISGLVQAAGPPGPPGFLAVLATEAVFTAVTGVVFRRREDTPGPEPCFAGRVSIGRCVLAASLLVVPRLARGHSWAVHSMISRRAGVAGLISCPLAQRPIREQSTAIMKTEIDARPMKGGSAAATPA